MKPTIVYGRVTEIYRDADWASYAGEPRYGDGEGPARAVRIAVNGISNDKCALMVMDLVVAPELAEKLELGSHVKVEVSGATEKEAAPPARKAREKKKEEAAA